MEKSRKEYIDSLWRDTLYGRWIIATAKGQQEEAERIAAEVLKAYPFTLENAASLISDEIAKELKYPGEFKEYIKILDKEDYALVDFMISNCSLFDKLYI